MVCDVRYAELPKSDYVFCCVDNDEARMAVLDQCLQSGTPLIDTGLEFYESQAGHVLVVDRELFPDGACVDCYLNLGRGAPEAGCIAAGITYSGRIIANVAAGMFVQHVHRGLKANHFFIDLNSCTAEFMFLRKRGLLDMRKAMRFFHFIFLMFSFAGEIIIERPEQGCLCDAHSAQRDLTPHGSSDSDCGSVLRLQEESAYSSLSTLESLYLRY